MEDRWITCPTCSKYLTTTETSCNRLVTGVLVFVLHFACMYGQFFSCPQNSRRSCLRNCQSLPRRTCYRFRLRSPRYWLSQGHLILSHRAFTSHDSTHHIWEPAGSPLHMRRDGHRQLSIARTHHPLSPSAFKESMILRLIRITPRNEHYPRFSIPVYDNVSQDQDPACARVQRSSLCDVICASLRASHSVIRVPGVPEYSRVVFIASNHPSSTLRRRLNYFVTYVACYPIRHSWMEIYLIAALLDLGTEDE